MVEIAQAILLFVRLFLPGVCGLFTSGEQLVSCTQIGLWIVQFSMVLVALVPALTARSFAVRKRGVSQVDFPLLMLFNLVSLPFALPSGHVTAVFLLTLVPLWGLATVIVYTVTLLRARSTTDEGATPVLTSAQTVAICLVPYLFMALSFILPQGDIPSWS